MKKIFESIADQWLEIDKALDRSSRFEDHHAVRTLGAPYYTTAERAARTAQLTHQIRLGNILRKAAKQERRRIEAKEGKKPWPPMLRWPFDLAA
jgi:hypothetical protein